MYRAIFWVQADDVPTLKADYAGLAHAMGLLSADGYTQEEAVTRWQDWLAQPDNDNWLLILDNAETPEDVHLYLPRSARGHVLITSRNVAWGALAHTLTVPVFTRDESMDFLHTYTQVDDTLQAHALAEALGDLPLALAQAAAYIQAEGSLTQYLNLFHDRHQELWTQATRPFDYPHTVQTTWVLAFECLQHESPASLQLLNLLAYLAPEHQPLSLFQDGGHSLPTPLATSVTDPLALNRVVAALRRYSLVERIGETLTVHRLVQVVTRDRLTDEGRQCWIDAAMQLIHAALARLQGDGHLVSGYVRHALEVANHVRTLPKTPVRMEQELAFLLTLGPIVMVTRGYAAPEVQHIYERVQTLCQPGQMSLALLPALFGLVAFYHLRAEHQRAVTLGAHLLTRAWQLGEPDLLAEAHLVRGAALWGLGDLLEARKHLDDIDRHYNPHSQPTYIRHYGQDPAMTGYAYGAQVLWLLGYPEQALQRISRAVSLAQEGGHPPDHSTTQGIAAVLHCFRRDIQETYTNATVALTLSDQYKFPQWKAHATVLQGWALAMQGKAAGIAQLCHGIADWQKTEARLGLPYFYALLAEAYGQVGQFEDGLTVLAEALNIVNMHEERWWEAEIYRLQGELTLRSAGADRQQAADCFDNALTVARRQEAKSLELRATIGLSRLLQHQGKLIEARERLEAIYNWFTEGFDTTDLQDANVLRKALHVGVVARQRKRLSSQTRYLASSQ
jgi:predicted ATPase